MMNSVKCWFDYVLW